MVLGAPATSASMVTSSFLLLLLLSLPTIIYAFSSPYPQTATFATSGASRCIDIQEDAPRDLFTFQQWMSSVGIQAVDGLQLLQTPMNEYTNLDGQDACLVYTGNQPLRSGTPILQIPVHLCFCSTRLERELGGNLEATENALEQYSDSSERLPLFRLMVKVLTEVENSQSPFQPWLNAFPRRFYNGVSMTQACFEALPPYASMLSREEKETYESFYNALRNGYLELSAETLNDERLIEWAYNVALTRHQKVLSQNGKIEKKLAPMADMINHSSQPNANIQYDLMGNARVVATQDIGPNTEITVSYGDSTNPTPLFAQYGFLVNDSPSIFCKALHLEKPRKALGYDYGDLLLDTQGGQVAGPVWDLFLFGVLLDQQDSENAQAFHTACAKRDEETKQAYHSHYFVYTLQALKDFCGNMLQDIDRLTQVAQTYNVAQHPRVPILLAHNQLVQSTFQKVQANLNSMG